jgi:DNA-binding transcriptional LysR family regulator
LKDIHFSALDLNLLRVFDALAEERSVTRAGARLGLTPSAISHALNRLRFLMDDELFVRGADGMRPTPRAMEVGLPLRRGLLQLQQALAPAEFIPETTERQFTVICGDFVGAVLLPGVIARLREAAPRVALKIRPGGSAVAEELDSGRADLALGGFGRIPDRFASEPLFSETMVWVLRADHPEAAGELTLERLVELPHLIIAPGEDESAVDGVVVDHGLERRVLRDDGGAFAEALASRGLRRRIALTIPNALSAPAFVAGSDVAALLPRRIAIAHAESLGLKLFAPPYNSAPFEIAALWRRPLGDQPALTWLRGLFRAAAAAL